MSSAPTADRPAPPRVLEFPVEGMHCAGCSSRLQRVLGAADGVAEASVNFASGRASVVVDGASLGQLRRVVQRAGFEVPRPGPPADEAEQARADDRARAAAWMRRAAVAWGASGIVMLAHRGAFGSASLAVAAAASGVAAFGAGWPFWSAALSAARQGTATMDTLVALGAGVAWGFSVMSWLVEGPGAEVWFEAAAMLTAFLLLGRSLEQRARGEAREAIRGLLALRVGEAVVVRGDGEREAVPAACLEVGDRVEVQPGARIPVDGEVLEGRSAVDASAWTGEPLPVDVEPGSSVLGGSTNGGGALVLEATAVGAASALEQVVRLLREAQARSAPVAALADRVAGVFVPAVIVLGSAVGLGWWLAGAGLTVALERLVTVIVVACPCALGLATPAAILVGSGRAARQGVLFRSGLALEQAAAVTDVVFDKTGTLTAGKPRVGVVELGKASLRRLAAVEARSEHVLSCAIAAVVPERPEPEAVEAVPGRGVRGEVEGVSLRAGSEEWFVAEPPEGFDPEHRGLAAARTRGETVVLVAEDGVFVGYLTVHDPLRAEAREVVSALGERGVAVHVLSGDHPAAVARAAAELGLPQERARGGLMPADKLAAVEELAAAGVVAVVGDGINDAPALAAAQVGIALASGAGVAVQAAPITLLRSDLRGVLLALDGGRRTLAVVRQNLVFALGYNALLVPLAAGAGLPLGFSIGPVWAAAAMAASSLTVLANALRLRR